ncbi:MAG: hypothetical protein ABI858_01155 [Pseudoxanthomonas sp.]
MKMKKNGLPGVSVLTVLLAMVASSQAWSASRKDVAGYPKELHGFWISELAVCPRPGQSFDSDNQMTISEYLLQGYEDRSKPSAVKLISRKPLAWKIEALSDIGPSGFYEKDSPKIFAISDERLTVTSEFHSDIYKKCEE